MLKPILISHIYQGEQHAERTSKHDQFLGSEAEQQRRDKIKRQKLEQIGYVQAIIWRLFGDLHSCASACAPDCFMSLLCVSVSFFMLFANDQIESQGRF